MQAELERLIAEIEDETLLTRELTGIARIAPEVLDALRATPREAFVGAGQRADAYLNQPLPIGFRQTISQPFIVAIMTQMLRPSRPQTILEIGSGSGYQAAVLARLVGRLVSVEIIPELAAAAAARLHALAVGNVEIHCADGHAGWPELAPYDGIIVTACSRQLPPTLIEQLRAGGRLVIPVGEPHGYQELRLIEKSADGSLSARSVLPVAFVPLTRRPASE